MHGYICHICHGLCDAGELENGVCHDCRVEAAKAQKARQLKIRGELNQLIRAKYREQSDGQMVMNYEA